MQLSNIMHYYFSDHELGLTCGTSIGGRSVRKKALRSNSVHPLSTTLRKERLEVVPLVRMSACGLDETVRVKLGRLFDSQTPLFA